MERWESNNRLQKDPNRVLVSFVRRCSEGGVDFKWWKTTYSGAKWCIKWDSWDACSIACLRPSKCFFSWISWIENGTCQSILSVDGVANLKFSRGHRSSLAPLWRRTYTSEDSVFSRYFEGYLPELYSKWSIWSRRGYFQTVWSVNMSNSRN